MLKNMNLTFPKGMYTFLRKFGDLAEISSNNPTAGALRVFQTATIFSCDGGLGGLNFPAPTRGEQRS